ncbi:PREDICTED: tRNA (guanine(26)-N(2))-dimethyltransferase-like [Acropora digitifera]|uniref:tRNA (guanine(26)-N(2))-dimethyltransferase-like n=1 Tax=Acropora digitifera TaxID=70779 RepID=UPI00077ABF6E|nr:PREDICTED: tRNA (guanine(26)-N(2))-dimethyltransferase-like [Acropora digitifera]
MEEANCCEVSLKDVENSVKVTEGKAEICFPDSNSVFYNPVQEFNRDLSTAVLRLFSQEFSSNKKGVKRPVNGAEQDEELSHQQVCTSELQMQSTSDQRCVDGITILEGLAASGLRSVRYALEVPGVRTITANDISTDAYRMIQKNIEHNNVKDIVEPSKEDAGCKFYKGEEYRYKDEKCFCCCKRGKKPGKTFHMETAKTKVKDMEEYGMFTMTLQDRAMLRWEDVTQYKLLILKTARQFPGESWLHCDVALCPSINDGVLQELSSVSYMKMDDFIDGIVQYYRVGRCIEEGRSKKYPPAQGPPIGPLCDQCSSKFHLGGPLWTAPIHDTAFVNRLLKSIKECPKLFNTSERIVGEWCRVCGGCSNNVIGILYASYFVSLLSSVLQRIFLAKYNENEKFLRQFFFLSAVVWDIMRCWEKLHPVKRKKENSPGATILSKEPAIQVSFKLKPGANPVSRQKKLLRYQENPEANWGPKPRAKRKKDEETITEKRQRLQGRRTVEGEKDYYKQFPCKRFKTGNCEYGDECKYSHDGDLKIGKQPDCDDVNHLREKSEGKTEDNME